MVFLTNKDTGESVKVKSISDVWDLYSVQYTKEDANYNAVGGGTEKACANCRWFSSPDGCFLVSGDISPTGLSKLWAAVPVYVQTPMPVEVTNWEKSKEDGLVEAVIGKVKSYFSSLLPAQASAEPVIRLIKVKDIDGLDRLRFFMPYTNNFEDRHGEIFASASHKDFESWLEENPKMMPDVWLWHVPGSKWGHTDKVMYDDTGFGFVSGLVDKGCEHIAESLAKSKDIGVSHSCWSLQRENVIEAYWSYEISPLPGPRAANIWHDGMVLIKEDSMTLDPTKRAWLVEHAGEDWVASMEKSLEAKAQAVAAQGVKSKEEETPVVEIKVEAQPTAAAPVQHIDSNQGPVTLEAITSAMQGVVDPLIKDIADLKAKQLVIEGKQLSLNEAAEKLFEMPLPEGYVASEKNKGEPKPGETQELEWMKQAFPTPLAGGSR